MFSVESTSFSLTSSEINLDIGFDIFFFCLWLYYIPSLFVLQDFFYKFCKLIINFLIVLNYLDYSII